MRPAGGSIQGTKTGMLSKLLTFLIGLPLAALLIVFCVVNRQPTTISLDIFGTTPSLSLTLPLFVLLLLCVIIGLLLGGVGTWLTQSHYRAKSARRRREIEGLRHEVEVSQERLRRLREEHDRELSAGPALAAPAGQPAIAASQR